MNAFVLGILTTIIGGIVFFFAGLIKHFFDKKHRDQLPTDPSIAVPKFPKVDLDQEVKDATSNPVPKKKDHESEVKKIEDIENKLKQEFDK